MNSDDYLLFQYTRPSRRRLPLNLSNAEYYIREGYITITDSGKIYLEPSFVKEKQHLLYKFKLKSIKVYRNKEGRETLKITLDNGIYLKFEVTPEGFESSYLGTEIYPINVRRLFNKVVPLEMLIAKVAFEDWGGIYRFIRRIYGSR